MVVLGLANVPRSKALVVVTITYRLFARPVCWLLVMRYRYPNQEHPLISRMSFDKRSSPTSVQSSLRLRKESEYPTSNIGLRFIIAFEPRSELQSIINALWYISHLNNMSLGMSDDFFDFRCSPATLQF